MFEPDARVRVRGMGAPVDAVVVRDTGGPRVRVAIDGRERSVPRDKVIASKGAPPVPRLARAGDPSPRAPRAVPKQVVIACEPYLAFVRGHACCACHASAPSDPHHYGGRGMGQKTHDLLVVPLCRRCHDYWHQHGCLPAPGLDTRSTAHLHFVETQLRLLVRYLGAVM